MIYMECANVQIYLHVYIKSHTKRGKKERKESKSVWSQFTYDPEM